jgi:hypothetical protein
MAYKNNKDFCMSKYVACIVIEVADRFKERKPDKEMMRRYLQNVVIARVVEESFYRQKIVLNIKNVNIEVQEV